MNDIIIVGVDGSETARHASEEAARLAHALECTLHVVTAVDRDVEVVRVGRDRWVLDSLDRAAAIAEEAARSLRAPGLDVTSSAAEGKPHDVLLAEATRLDARMIVVGNRGMQGLGRLLGSVASSVAHHAPCDVHIVKTV